ncbi:hypothetical protein BBJ28_00019360 [Nothophytophthora sp. Chile5]|nr:hypothetical protein BBJ28_00019360 [Nothophytophthora sp. Chile5]
MGAHDCFNSHFQQRGLAGRMHSDRGAGDEDTASKSVFSSFQSLSIMSLGDPACDSQRPHAAATGPSTAGMESGYPDSRNRFIAGERFYNHEMLGSLRKGGEVTLWSLDGAGLAAATFSGVLSFRALRDSMSPLLIRLLGLSSEHNDAMQRLVELPMTASVLAGLLSDAYPLLGTRRKACAMLGVTISALSVLVIAGLSACLETRSSSTQDAEIGLTFACVSCIVFASLGSLLTQLSVHTRTIELSQQETLCRRGGIQAAYLAVRELSQLVAAVFTFITVGDNSAFPKMKHSSAMLALVGISALVPLPIIAMCWNEGVVLRARIDSRLCGHVEVFWRVMQQKAVWRIVAFTSCFALFLGVQFRDSVTVVQTWADGGNVTHIIEGDMVFVEQGAPLIARCVHEGAMLVSILVWRLVFMNRPWRQFFLLAPLLQIVPRVISSVLITTDVVRSLALYRILEGVASTGAGVAAFANLVPLTEIALEGCEAATVGLVLTLQSLIRAFLDTTASLVRGGYFYDVGDVVKDTRSSHWGVLASLLTSYGINALALAGLFLLPLQKLDAQQERAFGGFSTRASSLIAAATVALFSFSLLANALSFVPGWSCLPIAGGRGCS